MANRNTLADGLNALKVAEKMGKPTARIKIVSSILKRVLDIFKKEGFIEDFSELQGTAANSKQFEVKLNGKINGCASISPQFPVKASNWEHFEVTYLPSKEIGVIVVTTSKGVMTHTQAKSEKLGGKLLAFVY